LFFSKGCVSDNFQNFWLNPQYCITLGEDNDKNKKIAMIVSLFQCESIRFQDENNGKFNNVPPIGFGLFKLNDISLNKINIDPVKFSPEDLTPIKMPSMYMAQRECTSRFYLNTGKYVIIPATYYPNISEKFLLRIFTDKSSEVTYDHLEYLSDSKTSTEPVPPTPVYLPVEFPISFEEHNIIDENERNFSRACTLQ
jgi:hypothetical protein